MHAADGSAYIAVERLVRPVVHPTADSFLYKSGMTAARGGNRRDSLVEAFLLAHIIGAHCTSANHGALGLGGVGQPVRPFTESHTASPSAPHLSAGPPPRL